MGMTENKRAASYHCREIWLDRKIKNRTDVKVSSSLDRDIKNTEISSRMTYITSIYNFVLA